MAFASFVYVKYDLKESAKLLIEDQLQEFDDLQDSR
jgi:hypothetical protein